MKRVTGMLNSARIIVIDVEPAEVDTYFQPERELIGNVEATLDLLLPAIQGYKYLKDQLNTLKG